MASADSAVLKDQSMAESAPTFIPFTKAERIQQLSDIDKSITQLLASAGLAIKTLTACQEPSDPTAPDVSRRDAFSASTERYLSELHSINVRMKRQVDGLKEAGIIAKERKDDSAATDLENEYVAGAGVGGEKGEKQVNLDVGWLNSRSSKVGMDMEAELWAQAREFLEEGESIGGDGHVKRQSEDVDMQA